MNMTLNLRQILAIILAVLGALTASTAQLTDLFGPGAAKTIISLAGLCNTILSIVVATISGQSSEIRAVQAMDGVDKIVVNERANSTLATLAVAPENAKIEAKPSAQAAVHKTAKDSL